MLSSASIKMEETSAVKVVKKIAVEQVQTIEPLFVKKLSENATLPVRGSAGAAGYDLFR